jgi:hypothetical protein
MVIDAETIAPPVLPKETVQVDEFGGEVVVRGLLLAERLQMLLKVDGSASVDGSERMGYMLHRCVRDVHDHPVMSLEGWEIWGAMHYETAIALWNRAMRLSGFNVEDERKNSVAAQS